MGSQFTASQLAALNQLYVESGEGSVPGAWLVDGSVSSDKIEAGSFVAPGDLAAVALSGDYADLTGTPAAGATAAQGAKADTAFGWGNHALAGYALATAIPSFVRDELTGTASGETSLALTKTPLGILLVYFKAAAASDFVLWSITTNYTFVPPQTITFSALSIGDIVQVYYLG